MHVSADVDYLPDRLTEAQRAAILHSGSPLLIIAGPGSGKTEVITWRAAHLVRSGRAKPENLLVTTFTNKAAEQLKDRIAARLPGVNVENMRVSTIHSFCAELLRRYRRQSPLPGGFQLLDEAGQLLLVFSERKRLGLNEIVKGRPYGFYQSVIALFNQATEELVEPDELLAWCESQGEACADKEADLWEERHVVAEAYRRYAGLLRESSLVDFAFLQRHALTLIQQHEEVRSELRDRFGEILVDEYQDTNAAQERLLGLIAGSGEHLTVVGDDDQSIYRFRGATVRNILDFAEKYPGARVIRLPDNFRSPEPIVDHSLRVIRHNPKRYEKALRSARGAGSDLLLVYKETAQKEASAVVEQLIRLKRARYIRRWGDVAILLRSVTSYSAPYISAMQAAGIPHHVIGDKSFFDRQEISQLYDLVSFLSASKAWGDRFVRAPLVGLTDGTIRALKAHKGDLRESATEEGLRSLGVEDEQDLGRLLSLLELKSKAQTKRHRSLLEIFYGLLAATGCVARFEGAGDEEALANLGVMSQLISHWDQFGNSRNFYAFQRYLKLLREGGVDPVAVPPEDAVQVMTIHQAKGLEFPVVVLGAAMNGRLPITKRRDHYQIPYDLRASGEPEVEDPHMVDERKLFYVAATRARDLLIIGTADVVNKRGGGPSVFLYEMFGDDLKGAADLTRARLQEASSVDELKQVRRSRFNYSDLAYYTQCPMRYKFTAVYGFEAPWMDPVGFGANVHRALEVIHRRALNGEQPSVEDVGEIVQAVWIPGRSVDAEIDQEARTAAEKQLKKYLREYGRALGTVVGSEDLFRFGFGDRVLEGKYDLLRSVEGERGVEVVDFKTSESVDPEVFGIDLQLDLYAMGVERDRGREVRETSAHFLRDGAVVSGEWTAEREAAAAARVASVLDRILAEDYTPNTDYCAHCDAFRDICAYGEA